MLLFATQPHRGCCQAIVPLTQALHDNKPSVRSKAIYALFNLKAVDSLVYALKDDDKYVREQAAKALGQLKNPKALEALSLLLEDSAFFVREAAKRALEQTKQLN